MIWCDHKLKPAEGAFQYCGKCGKAFKLPECRHKWKSKKYVTFTYTFIGGEGFGYEQQCEWCGELRFWRSDK